MPFGGFMPDIPRPAPQAPQPMTVGQLEDGKAALPLLAQRNASQGVEQRALISAQSRETLLREKLQAEAERDAARLELKKYGIDVGADVKREGFDAAGQRLGVSEGGKDKRLGVTEAGKDKRQDKKLEADAANLRTKLEATATNVDKKLAAKGSGGAAGSSTYTPEGKAILAKAKSALDQSQKELSDWRAKNWMKDDSPQVQAAIQRAEQAQKAYDEAVRRANQLKAGSATPSGLQPGQSTVINGVTIRRK
jgi:hypothetical protein